MKTLIALMAAVAVSSSAALAADLPVKYRHHSVDVAPVVADTFAPLTIGVPGFVTIQPIPWAAQGNLFPFNPLPNVDVAGFRLLGTFPRR